MQALILAGGEGTRLRPLTIYTPKPVVPIVNRPFLHYQIELLKRVGVTDITLCLSYQPDKIQDLFGEGEGLGVKIRYTLEKSPLGTAGAYKYAEKYLTDTTIVFNGDVLTDIDLAEVIAYHRERKSDATIVLTPVADPSAYGVVETDGDGRVLRFLEKPQPGTTNSKAINAGIYLLEPRVLGYIQAGEKVMFEYHVFPALLEHKEKFYAYTSPAYWLDIGTPQRYWQANDDLINGRVKLFEIERLPLKAQTGALAGALAYATGTGALTELPPRIDARSVIDPSCAIKPGAEIINSVLGPNCIVEERARIENSVLLANTRIGKQSEVRNSIIGRSTIIGRNSRIDSATLGDKSALTDYSIV